MAASPPVLELRSRTLSAIRGFFAARAFVEVETPVRVAAPANEEYIDAIAAGGAWLRASPELHMKRLLAAGHARLFQIGPCFRRGERGNLHAEEFTMLEWYRAGADYGGALEDARDLLRETARRALGTCRLTRAGVDLDLDAPWLELTVSEAFRRFAGWDPVKAFDPDRFDIDLVTRVEPALPRDRCVALRDYPAALGALARISPADPSVAERWELYVCGVELANAFSELTDPAEQRARFDACRRRRAAAGREAYPLDERFLAALDRGLPPCAGVALGLDRLVMLLAGAPDIDSVRAFETET